jgi:hypothetical protein
MPVLPVAWDKAARTGHALYAVCKCMRFHSHAGLNEPPKYMGTAVRESKPVFDDLNRFSLSGFFQNFEPLAIVAFRSSASR